jgi:hypothetical protein
MFLSAEKMTVIKYSNRFLRVATNPGETRIEYFQIISKVAQNSVGYSTKTNPRTT